MVVIKWFIFNFEHVKGERKFNFDTNNINMYFKQNKKLFINKIQSLSQSVFYWNSSGPPAGRAVQLHMIAIQSIFIYVNDFFFKLYGYSF